MMKKIIAYMNTASVQPLVEGLGRTGIRTMVVTEYYTPLSRVSRFIILCEDAMVGEPEGILRRTGARGDPPGRYIEVQDFDPRLDGTAYEGSAEHRLEQELT